MLTNQVMCDVTFIVGHDQSPIKAHKYMLASSSPVFFNMFNGAVAEKGNVRIPDVKADVFNELLQFIYTEENNITNENIHDMIYVADKYMMDELKVKCDHFLKMKMNETTAVAILHTAHSFNLEETIDKAMFIICCKPEECLSTAEFIRLSRRCVEMILKCNVMICLEEFLYDAVLKWGGHQLEEKNLEMNDKNVRDELGDLLYLVRFPIMKQDYFSRQISTRDILTKDEIVNVFQSFNDQQLTSCKFRTEKRLPKPIPFFRCEVNNNRNARWITKYDDDLDFKVDRDCFLKSVIIFTPRVTGKTLPELSPTILITSTEGNNLRPKTNWMEKLDLTTSSVHSETVTHVFYIPVPVKKEVRYTIHFMMDISANFFFFNTGKDYRPTVTVDDITVTFLKANAQSQTDVNQGQYMGIELGKIEYT
ncbi:BTB/POZ domain-containing protein 6-like [Mytilus californianus]|uniref:BTB/POZ domain-containing protein 6-like n=1 Tax=Mytilus californianus TaxID=6549 RepID=UPI002246807B|nr:BTB/POZ domain-containing protein 6-like [Mytilus californianus]